MQLSLITSFSTTHCFSFCNGRQRRRSTAETSGGSESLVKEENNGCFRPMVGTARFYRSRYFTMAVATVAVRGAATQLRGNREPVKRWKREIERLKKMNETDKWTDRTRIKESAKYNFKAASVLTSYILTSGRYASVGYPYDTCLHPYTQAQLYMRSKRKIMETLTEILVDAIYTYTW